METWSAAFRIGNTGAVRFAKKTSLLGTRRLTRE